MANPKRKRPPSYISKPKPARKRSSKAPLLMLGAAAVIGYAVVRDATADRMARNSYVNLASCSCAYSQAQCAPAEGRWVGPWYAVSAEDREVSDPGEGRHCGRSGGGGGYVYGGGRSDGDVSPRTGVETGYRGGFGATGRVRAAGS